VRGGWKARPEPLVHRPLFEKKRKGWIKRIKNISYLKKSSEQIFNYKKIIKADKLIF